MKKKIIACITGLAIVAIIAPSTASAVTAAELQAQINALLETLAGLQSQLSDLTGEPTGGTITGCTITSFTRNLKVGMSGDDVKCLQVVLNSASDTQLSAGVGSPGQETSYFGPKTKAAVIKFQEKYASEVLAVYGLTSGTGYVGTTTRAKLNSMLSGGVVPPAGVVCGNGICETGENSTNCPADCPVIPAGALGVSLASDSPVSSTIADGTGLNEAIKIKLTAGSGGQVSVSHITVTKSGISQDTDYSDFDVIDSDGNRHGNPISSLTAESTATINMSSDPIVIAAGTSEYVTVRFNIGTSASGTIQLGIASAADIVTDGAAVSGSFPMNGNIMTVVDGANSVAAVVLEIQPINSSGATYNVNPDSSQEIAKFSVQESSSNEKVKIERLTLYNNGNATDTDYKDVELVAQDGTILATAQPSGQYTIFDLSSNPYEIGKGITRYLTIRAKIISGTTRTIQFIVYNNYDLEVKGMSTSAYVLATTTSGGTAGTGTSFPVGSKTDYNKINIGAGSLTFSKSSTSPSSGIAAGTQSVVLAEYDVATNGEDMELRQMTLVIDYSDVDLTGTVFVKYNDSTIWSGAYSTGTDGTDGLTENNSHSTYYTLNLSTYPTVIAGTTGTISVVGSMSSSATGTYTAYLDITQVKRKVTNDLWDPSATQTAGNQISIQDLDLKVTTLSSPPAQSVVIGTDDFELARFDLDASASGEDIKVSTIIVTDTLGATAAYADINNLRMYNANNPGTPLTTSSSTNTNDNTVTFTFSSPITVARTTVVHLILKGNVISRTAAGSHTYKIANATGNVVATAADTGNTVTYASYQTISGTGQAMTIVASGNLMITLLSGEGKSPALNQTVNIGTQGAIVFAFKLTSLFEAQKITSLKLTATSATSALLITDLKNIALYVDSGSGTPSATPFATASQFSSCSSGICTYTWTASDNLLPSAIQPGTPVNIYVKADVSGENVVTVGDDFLFSIQDAYGTNGQDGDIICKGAYTGTTGTVVDPTDDVSAPGRSYIVPFSVSVAGSYPTEGSNTLSSVGADTTIGRFKVTNNGDAQVTVTNVKFTDNGSHTGSSAAFKLYISDENSSNYTGTQIDDNDTNTTVDFADLDPTTEFTLNGGTYRYVTVRISTITSIASGDSFNLSVGSLGDLKYKVLETVLGYDADYDQAINATISGLYVNGTPTVGTISKQ